MTHAQSWKGWWRYMMVLMTLANTFGSSVTRATATFLVVKVIVSPSESTSFMIPLCSSSTNQLLQFGSCCDHCVATKPRPKPHHTLNPTAHQPKSEILINNIRFEIQINNMCISLNALYFVLIECQCSLGTGLWLRLVVVWVGSQCMKKCVLMQWFPLFT